jgi:glucose-1-phosphate cytidylyltransferase
MLYTGQNTMTGGRIKKASSYINNEPFLLTYGDGVSDVNIKKLIADHQSSGKLITMTAVKPSGRFGALSIDDSNTVTSFVEKPKGDGAWINGGFFVCQPEVMNYIDDGDDVIFERAPLEKLAKSGQLHAYKHEGFWQPMDTLRDKIQLTDMWHSGKAPWKKWED